MSTMAHLFASSWGRKDCSLSMGSDGSAASLGAPEIGAETPEPRGTLGTRPDKVPGESVSMTVEVLATGMSLARSAWEPGQLHTARWVWPLTKVPQH